MSRENAELVRSFVDSYQDRDLIPEMRESAARLGPEPWPADAAASVADERIHPDIEWDSGIAGFRIAHGIEDYVRWWVEWTDVWSSYVLHPSQCRDLGAWVMTVSLIRASARGDMQLEMTTFQLWRVHDGKIARMRGFVSEEQALRFVEAGE